MVNWITLFGLISISVIALDQLVKYVISLIKPNLNAGIFSISYLTNTGAGFGLFQGYSLWLGIISLMVAIAILFEYKKIPKEYIPQILIALFLGGVVGNMIDRLFRREVIDFIHIWIWPAFNIADSAITISGIGLIIYFWKK
ncbi:signal peptidase II [Candidatus Woesearchaeota archaeon]|nr:signal peptidase II [Candidatus Woesearchaeota archaeon]